MKKIIVILILIIILIVSGIFLGIKLTFKDENNNNHIKRDLIESNKTNSIIKTTEILSKEEKTGPNTLLIFKTYYTKCKHYIKEYEKIDASKVNLTENEFKEKYRTWRIDSFSNREIELSKEEEKFCEEHYKLKLENNEIIIYKVDEEGREKEYRRTNIAKEYLPTDDITKLLDGIMVYGKENLNDTLEDYE